MGKPPYQLSGITGQFKAVPLLYVAQRTADLKRLALM